MRSLLLVLALAGSAFPLGAQDSCDADPRWIVVTIVGSVLLDPDGEPVPEMEDAGQGARMLDRCEIIQIAEVRQARVGGNSQALIQVSQGPGTTTTLWYVRESVEEICAAMDDCGDATVTARDEP